MPLKYILLTIFAFLLGMAVMYILMRYIIPNWQLVYSWVFNLRRNGRLGSVCKTDLILDRKGYSAGYSFDKKAALWVSYVVSKASTTIDKERSNKFEEDPDIPAKYRVKPSDFTNSGYDRGHLAPSSVVDFSRKSNDETFYMSNIAFQHPNLNRYAWKTLEQRVQRWVKERGRMFVVTGPVFNKERNKRIKDIAVPIAFYKVIYNPKHNQSIGFLLPNEHTDSSDLWDYALAVHDLEKQTGLSFMKKLPRRKRRCKLYVDKDWWMNRVR